MNELQPKPNNTKGKLKMEEVKGDGHAKYQNLEGGDIGDIKEDEVKAVKITDEDCFGVLVGSKLICRCDDKENAEGIANAIVGFKCSIEAIDASKKLMGKVMEKNEKLFRRNAVLEERNFVSKLNSFMFAFLAAVLFFLGIGMYRAAHATPQREATAKLIEALHDFKASHDMTFTENVFN